MIFQDLPRTLFSKIEQDGLGHILQDLARPFFGKIGQDLCCMILQDLPRSLFKQKYILTSIICVIGEMYVRFFIKN